MYTKNLLTGFLATTAAILVTIAEARSSDNALDGLLRRVSIDESPGALLKRQGAIPSVPTQCKSTCDPVNSVLSTGTCPIDRCCTTTFTKGYFDCFTCVADAVQLTDFSAPQALVDRITTTCASRGISLPVLTFPGQNPSRPLATVAPPTSIAPSVSRTTITNTDDITSTPSSSTTTSISQSTVTAPPSATSPPPSAASTPGAGIALRTTRGDLLGGTLGAFFLAKLLQIIL
ncbi:hypothetical protein BJ165DRAFT_1419881 [Panaeolus papilionaceus]|nr:hypothetical protein BJ165DRAFT_1419881 [Panaeolus papilionaceus]